LAGVFIRNNKVAKYIKTLDQSLPCLNKVDPSETNICNLEKKMFLTGAVLDVKQSGSSQKYADVSACLVKSCL